VGNRSTVDLSGLVPPKDGLLTSPIGDQAKPPIDAASTGGVPDMMIDDVRRSACAMPLSNPAFPAADAHTCE
jgi:hypothetical protein